MTETIQLSKHQARRFLLAKHALWPPRPFQGKAGVMAVFERLGCIQYDPLNVVGRNPDLVLQSRVVDYCPAMLYELTYVERQLYDYWDKMAARLPLRDWPQFELTRARLRQRHAKRRAQYAKQAHIVLDTIAQHGPMSSLDFKEQAGVNRKIDWRWGQMRAAKAILEMLWDTGELMVSHRQGTRRYYDLAERVLPEEIAAQTPLTDEQAYLHWRVARRCQGIGLVGPGMGGEIWARVAKAPERNQAIEALVERGDMVPVQIEGDPRTYHLLTADLAHLQTARADPPPAQAAFIAPLDNLLWSRNLIERLFDFKYVWEVYKPAEQRQYGYYVLPVLYGDRFVARFDAKLDRDEGDLHILSWHWQPGERLTDNLAQALRQALGHFLAYLDAERIAPAEQVLQEAPDLAALSTAS